MPKYERILLKLSGEALAGPQSFGLDAERVRDLANEIAAVARAGVQIGVVVGGSGGYGPYLVDGLPANGATAIPIAIPPSRQPALMPATRRRATILLIFMMSVVL